MIENNEDSAPPVNDSSTGACVPTLIGHISGYAIDRAVKGDALYVSTAILRSPNPAQRSVPVYTLSEGSNHPVVAPPDFKLLTRHEIMSEQKRLVDLGVYDPVRFASEIERLTLERTQHYAHPALQGEDAAPVFAPSTIEAAERAMKRIEANQAPGLYTKQWRDEVSEGRSCQLLSSEITDAELADPDYMRAYIAEMRSSYIEALVYWKDRAISAEKVAPPGYEFIPTAQNEGEQK
jgi:hypothetical protein